MLCTGALAVDFIIYTFNDFQVICINRDPTFIAEMFKKLKTFFQLHFRQAILDKYMANDYFTHISCPCNISKFNDVPGCNTNHKFSAFEVQYCCNTIADDI